MQNLNEMGELYYTNIILYEKLVQLFYGFDFRAVLNYLDFINSILFKLPFSLLYRPFFKAKKKIGMHNQHLSKPNI